MEQSPAGAWEWRMRVVGGEWCEPVRAIGRTVHEQVLHASMPFEVQWRSGADQTWQDAVPHEFGEASCDFIVKASRSYHHKAGERFVVCGMVMGLSSVWFLEMPTRMIAPDGEEILQVRGVAAQKGFGQYLVNAGDFQCHGEGFSVINYGKSQAALRSAPVCEVGVAGGRWAWAVKANPLPDHELDELKREIAPWQD